MEVVRAKRLKTTQSERVSGCANMEVARCHPFARAALRLCSPAKSFARDRLQIGMLQLPRGSVHAHYISTVVYLCPRTVLISTSPTRTSFDSTIRRRT